MDKKQEFLKRILATFRIEAEENINNISANLGELEDGCSDERKEEILEVIFRAAHSMKGASRAVNLSEIESVCHALEDVMSAIRSGQISLVPEIIELFTDTVDLLNDILNAEDGVIDEDLAERVERITYTLSAAEQGELESKRRTKKKGRTKKTKAAPVAPVVEEVAPVVEEKEEPPEPAKLEPEPPKEAPVEKKVAKKPVRKTATKKVKSTASDTIRISTKKLDTLLTQAEEMLNIKLMSRQRTKDLNAVLAKFSTLQQETAIIHESHTFINHYLKSNSGDVLYSRLDEEMEKIVAFQEWSTSFMEEIEKDVKEMYGTSKQEDYTSSSLIESLLADVKAVITVPFSVLLDGFPKMVRDIARDLEKKVDFKVEGDSIEIDRRILENLRTPLLHILRNSIDYGVEDVETRVKQGKSEKGNVVFRVEQLEHNKVEITITDDGPGLNREKLKRLYVEGENIPESEVDSVEEADYLNYIFRSGVSTSDIVTDLSGRGLGLAIVQETIEKMEGTIVVETVPGKSTTFRILLPISILTFRGVVIKAGNRHFIAPTSRVESVIRIKTDEIDTIENKPTVLFNGELLSIANLSHILDLPHKDEVGEYTQLIILETKKKKFALIIDHILGEQEVLVKSFNKQLRRVRNIAGATVLGSGEVVPVLNVNDLYQSRLGNVTVVTNASEEGAAKSSITDKNILIVEDSITSRTLLKNVLEMRGYNVTTAIDGLDGYTKLREIVHFDCVISDVEMPRMNGFELGAKIRATSGFEKIPFILITSLCKREHKERGIDVGANAYIVKSNFEQNTLFDILDTLL